jgi:predicted  nucleic acid-binding Zn-ribbon protein
MKKVPKKSLDTLHQLCKRVSEEVDEYNHLRRDAKDEIHNLLDKLQAKLSEKSEEITGLLTSLEDEMTSLTEDMDHYLDKRSENWQNSPQGEAYAEWRDLWINCIPEPEVKCLEPVILEAPEICEPADTEVVGEIERLIADHAEPPA